MKNDEGGMKDEGRMMKDDDFKLLRGFGDGRTNEQTFVIVESLSRLKKRLKRVTSYIFGFKPTLPSQLVT